MEQQLSFPFDGLFTAEDNEALWTPRDIWVRANQRLLEYFDEDRRFERKAGKLHFDDIATYYSAFSNTPDGGMIVFGINDDGTIVGCSNLSAPQLNKLENFHLNLCPQARPEFRRVPVVVNGEPDFCVAIYIPYIGRLVETNKDEAWIRYGDSKHKMSEPEKQDFRATRQETSFEMEIASYNYPDDFDLHIIQDFCDAYRGREGQKSWTNEEVLIDRHLLKHAEGKLRPLNSLVLMAAKDPRISIPGCRVRIQRFATEQEGVGETYSPQRDRTVEGNLVKIIKEASQIISEMIYDVTWLNAEGKFITTPEYPQ